MGTLANAIRPFSTCSLSTNRQAARCLRPWGAEEQDRTGVGGGVLDSEGLITDLVEYGIVLAGPKEKGHGFREKIRKEVH